MKGDLKIDVNVATLRSMNAEQFEALKANVLADGKWETEQSLRLHGGEYLGVYLDSIFIGIERDGYTHS
jgi:hypothetical protein